MIVIICIFAAKKLIMTINSLPTYCFSSAIPEIIISGVTDSVNVTVSFNQEIVLDEPLSPYGGQIKLYDLEELIKPIIEKDGAGYLEVEAEGSGGSVQRRTYVYYAATDVGTFDTFKSRHFLSLLGYRKLTGYGRTELLHIIGRATSARAFCYYEDGTGEWVQLKSAGGNSDYTSFDLSPDGYNISRTKRVVGYNVYVDGRQISYEVDQHEHEITAEFKFKNSFGMTEYLYCIGTVESNSSYDRSTVTINKQIVEYENHETRTFRCDTGFLCPEMFDFVEDFFRSKSIEVKKNGRWLPVLITECSTNFRNDDNAICRATFAYQYARNQNVL